MVLDRRVLNKYFILLIGLVLFTNLFFFLLNIATYEKIINEKFPDKYTEVVRENKDLKTNLEINRKIILLQRSIINDQHSHIGYYNAALIRQSIEQSQLLREQKQFFDKELKREISLLKSKIKKEKECQKELLISEQSESNLGTGGY